MSATITVQGSYTLAHKDHIDDRLWRRLIGRIQQDPEFHEHFGDEAEATQQQWAERIMNEALGFLRLCATAPGQGFGPSELVDIGWHTFILYTRSYADFCQRIGGRYIHHEPSDEAGVDYDVDIIPRTIAGMQTHGLAIDLELWGSGADCSNYCRNSCSGSSCTDTGRTGR